MIALDSHSISRYPDMLTHWVPAVLSGLQIDKRTPVSPEQLTVDLTAVPAQAIVDEDGVEGATLQPMASVHAVTASAIRRLMSRMFDELLIIRT